MNYKIASAVPIPPRKYRGRPPKYPWPEMEVGQSIEIATEKAVKSARACAFHYAQKHPGFKFVSRGLRIWRVEATDGKSEKDG